jgi:hypothetical protein
MDENQKDRPLTREEFDQAMDDDYQKGLRTETLLKENKQIQAEIQNSKLKNQKREMDKYSRLQDELESEDLTSRGFERDRMLKDVEDRKNAVTFINDTISEHFVAAPSSLMVVPSMTNNGKSTLTAKITETLVNENKRVLVLSNEEKEPDVRARVSCLRTNISFGDYKTNKCTTDQVNLVLDDAEMLADESRLVVISTKNESDAYKVTTVKGVMATLEKAKGNFDCVILDYYQNVNISEFGSIEPWHVNNKLASQLNIFKDSCPYPIVVMAQCKAIKTDKKIENKGQLPFESNHPMYRWKGGESILLYATDILELVRDFENSCSYIYAHKVRFGHGEMERNHCLPFDKKMQRFVEWSAGFDASVTASKVRRHTEQKTKEMDMANVFNKDK